MTIVSIPLIYSGNTVGVAPLNPNDAIGGNTASATYVYVGPGQTQCIYQVEPDITEWPLGAARCWVEIRWHRTGTLYTSVNFSRLQHGSSQINAQLRIPGSTTVNEVLDEFTATQMTANYPTAANGGFFENSPFDSRIIVEARNDSSQTGGIFVYDLKLFVELKAPIDPLTLGANF